MLVFLGLYQFEGWFLHVSVYCLFFRAYCFGLRRRHYCYKQLFSADSPTHQALSQQLCSQGPGALDLLHRYSSVLCRRLHPSMSNEIHTRPVSEGWYVWQKVGLHYLCPQTRPSPCLIVSLFLIQLLVVRLFGRYSTTL